MTPLLILIFGIQPVTAIGTDIFYGAITKTAGGVQHLKHHTVHRAIVFWIAVGSVPAAIAGVWVIEILQSNVRRGQGQPGRLRHPRRDPARRWHRDADPRAVPPRRDQGALRAAPLPPAHHRRGRSPASTTGFVIGLTSAGCGTLIAIILIAVFRLDAAARRRHRHLPRGRPALGGGHRPLGRRQRRLRSRRQHPRRLDPRRPGRRPARPQDPDRNLLRGALGVVLIASASC